MAEFDEQQWLQELQSFLDGLLANIIPKAETRHQYLTGDAMVIWARAFTHESVSPSDNYEELEFLGDAMLKAVFPKYLMRRFPHLHKNEFTELNAAYQSKMKQRELSQKMGLTRFIRELGLEKIIVNLEADVYESFYGALDFVSDSIKDGLGFANCYNMILYTYAKEDIDEAKGKGNPKTQVIQIFVRFDLSKPKETVDDVDPHNVRFSVSLDRNSMAFLKSYGVELESPVLGFGAGGTKKEAESVAYTNALNLLAEYGITSAWAEEARQMRDFNEPSIARYVEKAGIRLQNDGFVSMYFFIPRKTVTASGAIVQLVGVRENGQHEPVSYIYTDNRENSYNEAKTAVIRNYAENK